MVVSLLTIAMFATLGFCVVVWPTQWITDAQNRWVRIIGMGLVIAQLIVEGFSLPLLGAYAVAALFALLLIPRGQGDEPSSVRESKEGSAKKLSRWAMVTACGASLIASIVWRLVLL